MRIASSILTLCLICLLCACVSDKIICDGRVVIHSKDQISFSKNEQPLLCGDQDLVGWKNVPLAQTEMTIKEFLKSRGFYESTYTLDENQLHIETGPSYKIEKIVFIDAPEDFDRVKFVGWKKQPFTGPSLNDIEAWTLRRLKSIGYGCAQVRTIAIIETKTVEVHIQAGKKYPFPEITYDDDPDQTLRRPILERYYAFKPGQLFNEDLLTLSSHRTEWDGVVSHSNFIKHCENEELTITQNINLGTSRILTVGAGVSTEELGIGKVNWKDSRKGRNASIIFADLYGSKLRQFLQLGYEWHAFDESNRWYLLPTIEGERIDESDQEYYTFVFYPSIGSKLDYAKRRLEFKTGPAASFENVQNGPSSGKKEFVTWRSSFTFTSHDYEVFMTEPRRGYHFTLETSSVILTSVDKIGANWVNLSGTRLWNLFNFGPPKFVFGARFGLESVISFQNQNIRDNIPQTYFTWLGGDTNLRGFGRQELPVDEIGTFSSIYSGFELRFVSLLMKNLDPFVFTDVGLVGSSNFTFNTPVYWSPGFGLRYQSFIGVIRGTVAHGYSTGASDPSHEHFQYFLSLGREF